MREICCVKFRYVYYLIETLTVSQPLRNTHHATHITLQRIRATARRGQFLYGGLAELGRRHHDSLGDVSVAEHLDAVADVADDAALDQQLRRDLGARLEAVQVADVDD